MRVVIEIRDEWLLDYQKSTSNEDQHELLREIAGAIEKAHPSKEGIPDSARLGQVPFSEVAMHMGVAGRWMWLEPLYEWYDDVTPKMVQLYDLDGRKFSAPILPGEAGWR